MGAAPANRLPAAERVLGAQENEAVTLSLRDASRRNKQLLEDQAAANEALEVIQLGMFSLGLCPVMAQVLMLTSAGMGRGAGARHCGQKAVV